MSRLGIVQLEDLWRKNGGTKTWAPLMAGIALAESGGTPLAFNTNPKTGDKSVGLWQINFYGGNAVRSQTPHFGGRPGLSVATAVKNAKTPTVNAKAAVYLFGRNAAGISNWKGDRIWTQWVKHGSPQKPSTGTVQLWLAAAHVTYPSTMTTAGGANATVLPGVNVTTSTPQHTPTACALKFPGVVGGIGSFCILSKSQLKAIEGGLLVAAGGAVMALGIVLLTAYGLGSKKAQAQVARVRRGAATPKKVAAGVAQGRQRRADERTERRYEQTAGAQRREAYENARHRKESREDARYRPRATDAFTTADRTTAAVARLRRQAGRAKERRPRARR